MKSSTAVTAPAANRTRQTTENIEKIVGNLTPQLRQRIITEWRRHSDGRRRGTYERSRLVSKNLGISEAVVDEVIFTHMEAVESELATVRTGMCSVLAMATDAGRAVWAEKRGAA
jgi:hypothetical protein